MKLNPLRIPLHLQRLEDRVDAFERSIRIYKGHGPVERAARLERVLPWLKAGLVLRPWMLYLPFPQTPRGFDPRKLVHCRPNRGRACPYLEDLPFPPLVRNLTNHHRVHYDPLARKFCPQER